MRAFVLACLFAAGACVSAQDIPSLTYDHKVLVDGECRITLRPIQNPDKPKTKKNDALCEMVKDKDTTARQAIMFEGVPRTVNVNIREMSYKLQNPTQETLHFTLTYKRRKGLHMDPNGGTKPKRLTETEAIYDVEVRSGETVNLDMAERDH